MSTEDLRQSLAQRLAHCSFIKHLHVHETLGSTNDEALRLIEEGAPSGTLIVALKQEQGRGRLKRSWLMQEGDCASSLLLRKEHLPHRHSSLLPLVMALAVHDALMALNVPTELKWPNDIVVPGPKSELHPYFLHYLKLGGILVESTFAHAELSASAIGIGINIKPHPELERLLPYVTSVQRLAPPIDLAMLLDELIAALDQAVETFTKPFFSHALARYERVSATLGHEVMVNLGAKTLCGIAVGFNEQGALLVAEDASIFPVYSGEVVATGAQERRKGALE